MRYTINDKIPLSKYRRIMADKYNRAELIPWWKLPITYNFARSSYICAPIGFHIIFRSALTVWDFFRLIGWDARMYYQEQLKLRDKL